MVCVQCRRETDENVGTDENPLCKECFNKFLRDYNPSPKGSSQSSLNEIWRRRGHGNLIGAAIVIGILTVGYFALGLFVVQPIGAVPDGATVLYLRMGTNMPFISSADGLLAEKTDGVSLFGRGLALGMVAKLLEGRKIIALPYSSALYLISTSGKTYESSPSSQSLPDHPSSYSDEKRIAPTDFQIISQKAVWEDDRLRLKGEIRNNGTIAGGPQVEVIARDAKGVLLDSQQFWPNSITNIPPGGTCGMSYTITQDRRAKTFEVKVIDARVW